MPCIAFWQGGIYPPVFLINMAGRRSKQLSPFGKFLKYKLDGVVSNKDLIPAIDKKSEIISRMKTDGIKNPVDLMKIWEALVMLQPALGFVLPDNSSPLDLILTEEEKNEWRQNFQEELLREVRSRTVNIPKIQARREHGFL